MARFFPSIAESCYSFAKTLAKGVLFHIVKLLHLLLVCLHLWIGLFVVSYFRLRRCWYGVLCWDGTQVTLSYRKGSLLAVLCAQYANAFPDVDDLFVRVWVWLYDVRREYPKSRISYMILQRGIMPFYLLAPSSAAVVSRYGAVNSGENPKKELCIKKTKSVTFNENVEVHLISPAYFQHDKARYLSKRNSITSSISPILTRSFVQHF